MATSHKYEQKEKKRWTYGAELEIIDWPRNEKLPFKGMAIDEGAYTNVNSNGVAADGPGKLYHLGGEILTEPSVAVSGPADQLECILACWPEARFNYRMGLNVHVRVPGLQEDVKRLKKLQLFAHEVMPDLLHVIDPIPVPTVYQFPHHKALDGAKKNYATRLMDHHTLLKPWRLDWVEKARTPQEVFEAEAVDPKTGKVHWALHARTCVNLRQLLQTDTVEFRHFPMPINGEELLSATEWCKWFLEAAFDGGKVSAKILLSGFGFGKKPWPKFLTYDPWLDEGYHYTTRRYHPASEVPQRIKNWLGGMDKESVFWKG